MEPVFDNAAGGKPAKANDVLTVLIKIPKQQGFSKEKVYPILIHKERDVIDIHNKIITLLDQDGIQDDKFMMLY